MDRGSSHRIALGIFAAVSIAVSSGAARADWLKGNTRCRSSTDGGSGAPSAERLAAWYRDHGYRFLAIAEPGRRTDSGSIGGSWAPDLILIAAVDAVATCAGKEFHTVALDVGAVPAPAPCGRTEPATVQGLVDSVLQAGGLPVLSHPLRVNSLDPEDILPVRGLKLIEAWAGPDDAGWPVDGGAGAPGEVLWDQLLTAGMQLYAVAADGADSLDPLPGATVPGCLWTMVDAPDGTPLSIRDALEYGRFYATSGVILRKASVEGERLTIEVDREATDRELSTGSAVGAPVRGGLPGFAIEFIGPGGKVLSTAPSERAAFPIGDKAYLRSRITRSVPVRFIRGDANLDQAIDISDAIRILFVLFLGVPAPSCLDPADANDDGKVDIADAVCLLLFLFGQGPPPPEPCSEMGPDPTPDALDCLVAYRAWTQPVFPRRALIRFEDVGPGAYVSARSQACLRVMGDFLASRGVPFHVGMIPRWIDSSWGFDASIDSPEAIAFRDTIGYLAARGATIGIHGYTHQYGTSASSDGYEFYLKRCRADCPPDDPAAAAATVEGFRASYVSSRLGPALDAVRRSGIPVAFFETPHYTASAVQRTLLSGWTGLFFEPWPGSTAPRSIAVLDLDTPFSRGAIYVPTLPPGADYVQDASSIDTIFAAARDCGPKEVAAFYFHPFLEIPSIGLDGDLRLVSYDRTSYLHRLVDRFQAGGFRFVSLADVVPFVPSIVVTGFFGGADHRIDRGDVDGDGIDELIVRNAQTGAWSIGRVRIEEGLLRTGDVEVVAALAGWGAGAAAETAVGDFDGDGKDDVGLWNGSAGEWAVALSDGDSFHPRPPGNAGWNWTGDAGPRALAGDFDADGRADLLLYAQAAGEWRVARSTGTGFEEPLPWLSGWAKGGDWVARAADIDGDRRADVAVFSAASGSCQVALSTGARLAPKAGNGTFEWMRGWGPGEPLLADLEGDGRADLLVARAGSGSWRIAFNTGNEFILLGAFEPWVTDPAMQPLAGRFTRRGASLCARLPDARGGTVLFAVPTPR